MIRNYRKLASLVCAGMLLLTSLTISGCTTKATRSTRDTTETSTPANTPTPTNTPTPSPTPTPDPQELLRLEAVSKAESVHMKEEDLRGKHELFLEYAKIVDENPNLDRYRAFVYHIFPVVAEQLKDENKEFFLGKLQSLRIATEGVAIGNAGEYYDADNMVLIDSDQYMMGAEEYARTVFHELMHFVDYQIDGDTEIVYKCKDRFVRQKDMTDKDWDDFSFQVDSRFITEGGAELYTAKNFNYSTVTYELPTQFMTALEYIYGTEFLDDLFFRHDSTMAMIDLMQDAGFTMDEITDSFQTLHYYTYPSRYDLPKKPILAKDVLIRLYQKERGEGWAEDKQFLALIRMMDESAAEKAEPQFPEQVDLYIWDWSEMSNWKEEFTDKLESKYSIFFMASGVTGIFLNGKFKAGGWAMVVDKLTDRDWHQSILVDYDYENDKVLSVEYPESIIPEEVPDRLPAGAELDARLASLRHDNTAAHEQVNRAWSVDKLKDVKQKAVDIGNKYGITIYVGDTMPVEDKNMYEFQMDPERVEKALDQIDLALARYPLDLFDQLCFGYIYGIDIYLMGFAYPEQCVDIQQIDGKWHHVISLDTSSDKNISRYQEILAADISLLIDRYMLNYYENVEEPTYTLHEWMNYMPAFCRYCGTYYSTEDDYYKENKQYFVNKDAMTTAAMDRSELFKAVMQAVIAKEDPDKKTEYKKLTGECLDKVDFYFDLIREIFDTSNWPEVTCWEQEVLDQYVELHKKQGDS